MSVNCFFVFGGRIYALLVDVGRIFLRLRDDVGIVPYGFYPRSVQDCRGDCWESLRCGNMAHAIFEQAQRK